jgi:ubiquinone/menaquinone biosynthesis C-methylase UbiE
MTTNHEDGAHWDRAASTYDSEHREWLSETFENKIRSWLARRFTPDDDVLELGCGTGIFSEMIAGRVRQLTATDFSPEMLERAGQRLSAFKNVNTRKEDARRTSFVDGAFDAVLTVNLFHHASEPAAVARECSRVVRPGGRVVVIDCAGHTTSLSLWIDALLRCLRLRNRPKDDHHHLSIDDLTALLTGAGLTVQEKTHIAQRRPRTKYTCLRATKQP